MMTTIEFADWLKDIEDVEIVKIEENCVFFFCQSEDLVIKFTKIAEETKNSLSLRTHENKICFVIYNENLEFFIKKWIGENKKGLPDLSWITMKQFSTELKKRDNLTFALVWIEENGNDNISLEASGNPTTLCGMLTRALNLAVRHADKNIDYRETRDG